MDVTDVIRDRAREPGGFERMVTVSVAAHAALIASVALLPGRFWQASTPAPRAVMTITLGGSPGPANGGFTSIGGRPVQTAAPPPNERREAVRPPAAKAPEMVLPRPGVKPVPPRPSPAIKQAPDEARGRTPTRGDEARAGSAVADTGARGQGFGLSTGGGAGSGSYLDVTDFCCPDYIAAMIEVIRRNWNAQQEVRGDVLVKFTVQRDGTFSAIQLERSSGHPALDVTAQRSLYVTRQVQPLPAAFPDAALTIHLNFQYQ